MNKLKTKSILTVLLLVVFLLFFGTLLISASNLFYEEPEVRPLYEVPREELEGAYVTVDLTWIYDYYAYTETYEDNKPTGTIIQKEYLIDANELDYMCLILEGDMMKQADALLEECIAYANWEIDAISKYFTITGQVKALGQESIDLLHDYIGYDQLSAEDQAIFLPLYLAPADHDVDYAMLIIGVVMLFAGLILLFTSFKGSYQKQVKKKLTELFGDNTERADEFLRQLMETPSVANLHINGGFILLRQGMNQALLDDKEVVWAYKQTTQQKLYGIIPAGKTYQLVIKKADGKELSVAMTEEQVAELLKKIASQFPSCAIGYSDQLAAMYKKDPNIMRQVAAAQREKAANP